MSFDLHVRLFEEISAVLAGVRDTLRDPYRRRGFLDRFGFRPDAELPSETSWFALDRMDAILGEANPTWEQRRQLVDEVLIIAGVLEDFYAAGRADVSDAEVAADLVVEMLELASLSYVRTRYPRFHAWARMFGFFVDFGTTYKTEAYRRDAFARFWTGFGDWFAGWYRSHPLTRDADGERLDEPTSADVMKFVGDLGMIVGGLAVLSKSRQRWFWGWDPAPDSTTPLADAVSARTLTFELTFGEDEPDEDPTDDVPAPVKVPITVMLMPAVHGGPALFVSIGAGLSHEVRRGDWTVAFELSSTDGLDLVIPFRWLLGADSDAPPTAAPALPPRQGHARIVSTWGDPDGGLVTVGDPAGTRFEFRTLAIELGGEVDGTGSAVRAAAGLKATIRQGALVIHHVPLLGDVNLRLEIESELGLALDTEQGLHLVGAAGLVLTIPLGAPLPQVNVPFLEVGLIAAGRDGATELTVHVAASLAINTKAFKLVLDRIGYRWRVTGLGDEGVLWPTGIGVALDLGPVSGGGYLFYDEPRGLYGGALQLALGSIALSAYGLVQRVDGVWSCVVFLGLETGMLPPVFGVRLVGVGGLWAKDRTVNVDAIADGLKTRILDDLLFPRDVVVNAPRLIASVGRAFPFARGQTVCGPMLKFELGTPAAATMAVGLLFEWPDPSRMILLGTVQSVLPTERIDVARVIVDVIGWWDRGRNELEVYGTLRDSKIASFTLQGTAAIRSIGGDEPFWGVSIGGFHPSYTPPVKFRPMDRVALDFTGRDNPRLRFEGYLAVTSNSFQIGGKIELVIRKAGFSIEGRLALDALWTDGTYEFGLSLTVALKRGTTTLFGIHFEGVCTGPRPFTFRGKASVSFFFFSVSFPLSYRGSGDEPAPLPPSDPTPDVLAALRDVRSWGAELPPGGAGALMVRPRPAPAGTVRVHPLGRITITQNVVPLGVDIARFGPSRPSGARRFELRAIGEGLSATPIRGHFAAGQFLDLSDAERLSRPAFEKMDAGLALGVEGTSAGEEMVATMAYETFLIDTPAAPARSLGIMAIADGAVRAAIATGHATVVPRGHGGRWATPAAPVRVRDHGFVVADATTLAAVVGTTTYTAARAALGGEEPARRLALRVVAAHERAR